MRNSIVLAGIAFAGTLAVVIGSRLSNEALAVVVGAVCGVSASIPVSLALVLAVGRNWGRPELPREIGYDYESRRYAPQPPMVVVSPPQNPTAPYAYPQSLYYGPTGGSLAESQRSFKIVGED
jgi:hypothetical protein